MSNIYDQEQQQKKNQRLDGYATMLEDQTYEDRNKSLFGLAEGFRTAFPILSGLTLAFASFRLIFGELALIPSLDWPAIIANAVYFLLALIVVIGVEMLKANTLNSLSKERQKRRKPSFRGVVIAVLCILVSIVGSSAGGYMLTLDLTDKSVQINQAAELANANADANLEAEIAAITSSYETIIAERRAEVNRWHPQTYRTKRSQATTRLNATVQERDNKIAAARSRVAGEKENRTSTATGNATVSTSRAQNFALIGGCLIFILEVFNLLSITFFWKYIKQAVDGVQVSVASAGQNADGSVTTDPTQNRVGGATGTVLGGGEDTSGEKIIERHIYHGGPPDNTNKTYQTGKGSSGTKSAELLARLRDYRRSNPTSTKSEAVKALSGQVGRTFIYNRWDICAP